MLKNLWCRVDGMSFSLTTRRVNAVIRAVWQVNASKSWAKRTPRIQQYELVRVLAQVGYREEEKRCLSAHWIDLFNLDLMGFLIPWSRLRATEPGFVWGGGFRSLLYALLKPDALS
jgi:hypothetical protein